MPSTDRGQAPDAHVVPDERGQPSAVERDEREPALREERTIDRELLVGRRGVAGRERRTRPGTSRPTDTPATIGRIAAHRGT